MTDFARFFLALSRFSPLQGSASAPIVVLVLLLAATGTSVFGGSCVDNDNDGYGVNGDPSCLRGTIPDCDDTNDSVRPFATEFCDGLNNDCNNPNWPAMVGFTDDLVWGHSDDTRSVFAADLDGDGDRDIVAAASDDHEVAWYENLTGDGSSWARHVIIQTAVDARAVFSADVDGDDDLDVLSASFGDDTVAWYENSAGDASVWLEHPITTTLNGARSLFAADFDDDDDVDVLTAGSIDDRVVWFENTAGDGSMWVEKRIADTDSPVAVYGADIDGDGDLDAVVGSSTLDLVAWYENDPGIFAGSWDEHVISTAANDVQSVIAADVDGDTDIDVVSASQIDNKIAWYENTASDGSAWTELVVSTAAIGARSVAAADLDADGDFDLVSASLNDDTIAFHVNSTGDGTTWAEVILSTAVDGAAAVTTADIDGDGDADVVSGGSFDNDINWYPARFLEGDEDGDGVQACNGDCDDLNALCTFDCTDGDGDGYCVNFDCDDAVDTCAEDCVTDFDGDGRLACADCNDGNINIFAGAPEICDGVSNDCNHPTWPELDFWVTKPISSQSFQPYGLAAADLDGDGRPDPIVAEYTFDEIVWYSRTNGDGTAWTPQVIDDQLNGPYDVAAADVDGDGDLDVISAAYLDDRISWHENVLGDASSWATHFVSAQSNGARSVFAADLDGDTDIDIVVASFVEDTFEWFENLDGNGSTWMNHVIATGGLANGARSIHAADFDGDDDLDVLAAAEYSDRVVWYENVNGDALLWTEHLIAVVDAPAAVFADDVDGDNDLDALATAFGDDEVAWWENSAGDGSVWTEHVISAAADGAYDVFAIDLDGDDDIDAVSTSLYDDTVAWYENTTGDGLVWIERVISTSADAALAVFAADVDDDGDPDVLSTSLNDSSVSWYVFNSLESDDDADGLANCQGDCNDANPNCSTDCSDPDGDGFCVTSDCDESKASCNEDCVTDVDEDGVVACLDCDDANGAIYPGAPEVCDGLNNSCDQILWPALEGWGEQEVSRLLDYPNSVVTADIDDDGDPDALTASLLDHKVTWHENATGDGSSWTIHLISDSVLGATSAVAGDIDGDGDLDAISASFSLDDIAWHENVAGDGTSWTTHVIATNANGARSVFAADVDGDTDLDVLSASQWDDRVAWYENTSGDGSAWTIHVVSNLADSARSVYAADVDGDNDLDLLSASRADDSIVWYENLDGAGTSWAEHEISVSVNGAYAVVAGDIDGDTDVDVVAVSSFDDEVIWFDNVVGDGSVWTEVFISTTSNGVESVWVEDMDDDSDLDVVAASGIDDTVAWHENTAGDGSAWTAHVLSTSADGAASVTTADVDGDGDPDVLSASSNDDKVAWYRFNAVEGDDDGDGLAECEGDCDDANRFCNVVCIDDDEDGFCLNHDCDETNPLCDLVCSDLDGDDACSSTDCDESDPESWQRPSEVPSLVFDGDKATLIWTVPAISGGTVLGLVYDTLRTGDPADFDGAADCVESDDGLDTQSEDLQEPLSGNVFFYLIRAETACGAGPLGQQSNGFPRADGRVCEL